MGASNNSTTDVSATNYIQGNIHALVWLPVIPTEAQELAIRNYVALKAGILSPIELFNFGILTEAGEYLETESGLELEQEH